MFFRTEIIFRLGVKKSLDTESEEAVARQPVETQQIEKV
jgi:hypothetical protein